MAKSKVVEMAQEAGVEAVEVVEAAKAKREPAEVVEMVDGRSVEFAGKRRMLKENIFSDDGAPGVRFDFRNGQTLTAWVPEQHRAYSAAHGYGQKLGDEVAGAKDEAGNPVSEEDMYLAIEALHDRLVDSADWNKVRTGEGGVGGAAVVLRAVMEVSGKPLTEVKALLDRKLAEYEARGQKLTRAALYASLRNPTSRTGQVIERMEREKRAKASVVDSDELMDQILAE